MTRLVIHAGDCKSGSTAIQSVLRDGTYEAPEGAILYPTSGRRDGLNHHRLSNSLFMAKQEQIREQAWTRLGAEYAEAKEDNVVISSERFEFADPNSVKQALEQYVPTALEDLHLILYVRPHIDRVVSGYVQNVKQGIFRDDMRAFIKKMDEERRFHFAPRLKSWRSVFGEEQITIRPMIRSMLDQGCVVRDFLGQVVGAGQVNVSSIPNANSSLSGPALAMVRALWQDLAQANAQGQAQPRQKNPSANLVNALVNRLESEDLLTGGKVQISRADAEFARDCFADDARDCDVHVFQQPLMGPALNKALEAAPEFVEEFEAPADALGLSRIWIDIFERTMAAQAQKAKGRNPNTAQWRGMGR